MSLLRCRCRRGVRASGPRACQTSAGGWRALRTKLMTSRSRRAGTRGSCPRPSSPAGRSPRSASRRPPCRAGTAGTWGPLADLARVHALAQELDRAVLEQVEVAVSCSKASGPSRLASRMNIGNSGHSPASPNTAWITASARSSRSPCLQPDRDDLGGRSPQRAGWLQQGVLGREVVQEGLLAIPHAFAIWSRLAPL